jgi:dienelactone hydrolase
MTIQTKTIDYQYEQVELQGYLAWDDAVDKKRPGVMVSHAWRGRTEFENARAEDLAKLGYVGFALDLYGKGVQGNSVEENSALMKPFLDDRQMLQNRLSASLDVLKSQEEVDESRTAAMGYCFGGLCVLDLARTGAEVNGVTSFHGLFGPPGNTAGNKINAKVLVLHGWDDPMATPDQVVSLAEELSGMGADWQIHGYGNTMHAFTNPDANDPDFGTVYQADADRRSWNAMQDFLSELFS